MFFISELINKLFYSYHSFFYWRDTIEILFFSSIIYYISLWLKKDKQKNLLLYFYTYSTLLICSDFLQLTTINHILFILTPVTCILFIVIHQQSLQKNIIALNNITPISKNDINWVETFIQVCLSTINKKKTVTFVLEHKNNLSDYLQTDLLFQANIQYDLFTLLINSSLYNKDKMIWITSQGKLVGLNALWSQKININSTNSHISSIEKWQQEALFFTNQLDSLIIQTNPKQHTFTIIVNGMTLNNMQATNTLLFIKNYITQNKIVSSQNKGNYSYDTYKKRKTIKEYTY